MSWLSGAAIPSSLQFVKWSGGFGVPLFFVISAFTLSFRYGDDLLRDGAGLRQYFIRRFARIAPLFYVMLIFWSVLSAVAFNNRVPAWDLLLNALFVFNLSPRLVDGVVAASWSIGVEMVFYLMLPVLLVLTRRAISAIAMLVVVLIVAQEWAWSSIGPPAFTAHSIFAQAPYFAAGLLTLHAYRHCLRAGTPNLLSAARYAAAFLSLATLLFYSPLLTYMMSRGLRASWDAAWAVPFGLLCVAVALRPVFLLVNPLTLFFGRVSYSLYLTHPAVIALLKYLGAYQAAGSLSTHPLVTFPICAGLTIAVTSAVSWVTFNYIEQPGMRWGARASALPVAGTMAPAP